MTDFSIFKGAWGILITIATLWIGYSQYQLGQNINRPSISIRSLIPSDKFLEAEGNFSHAYTVKNDGPVTAKNLRITAITKLDERVIHEDIRDNLGDFVKGEAHLYEIFLHNEDFLEVNINESELIEEIILEYGGVPGVKFWCKRFYKYEVVYEYNKKRQIWDYHQEVPGKESVNCR